MAGGERGPRRRWGASLLLACAALAACADEPTLAEKNAADARAVAQVEAIQKQKPPPRPIFPQPIGFDEVQTHNLYGSGCAFTPVAGTGPVLLAQDKAGYVRLGGRLMRLASDPGSTPLPLGAWSRYTGRKVAVTLVKADGDGQPGGSETMRWPGRVTITDPFDQVIYTASGAVECGS